MEATQHRMIAERMAKQKRMLRIQHASILFVFSFFGRRTVPSVNNGSMR